MGCVSYQALGYNMSKTYYLMLVGRVGALQLKAIAHTHIIFIRALYRTTHKKNTLCARAHFPTRTVITAYLFNFLFFPFAKVDRNAIREIRIVTIAET